MNITEEQQNQLIQAALEGMKNAFTGTNKPENMRFGAAVLTKKGNVYSSGQYYSDTYSLTLHAEQAALAHAYKAEWERIPKELTLHAEQAALAHAAAHGEYEIVAVAITGNAPSTPSDSIYPCHMCKQLLWESHLRSKENTEIILLDKKGQVLKRLKLLEVINYPWPKEV